MRIKDTDIENKKYQKLLRIKVGTKLNFNKNFEKANHKVHELSRVIGYMSLSDKKRVVFVYYVATKSHSLKNYWSNINLFQYKLEICKC